MTGKGRLNQVHQLRHIIMAQHKCDYYYYYFLVESNNGQQRLMHMRHTAHYIQRSRAVKTDPVECT